MTGAPSQHPFRLSICARAEVGTSVRNGVTHLLSIDDPGPPTPTPLGFRGKHWHILFQDVHSESDAKRLRAIAPTRDHIREILQHATECFEDNRIAPVHLLVHCMAGGSRSPAVALLILSMKLGQGREPEALSRLLQIKPDVLPNEMVVRLGDELLQREGRLMKALAPLKEEMQNAINAFIQQNKER